MNLQNMHAVPTGRSYFINGGTMNYELQPGSTHSQENFKNYSPPYVSGGTTNFYSIY